MKDSNEQKWVGIEDAVSAREEPNPKVFEEDPVYREVTSSSEFTQFYNEKGDLITLRYRKPEILRPEKVKEIPRGHIG